VPERHSSAFNDKKKSTASAYLINALWMLKVLMANNMGVKFTALLEN
jgi:hypothetical protein